MRTAALTLVSQRQLKDLLKRKEAITSERADLEVEVEALEKRRQKLRERLGQDPGGGEAE